ncbi:MAG: DUF61 family protein [Promethearchaeota archaeon]
MSPLIEKMIERDIDTLNDHLPETRYPLSDLVKSDSPQFKTRDGEISVFRREELDFLATEVPTRFHDEVHLPIVLLRRLDYGTGIYTIAGNKIELFTIHHIIGYVDLGWEDFGIWEPVEKLARPQVQILRRKLPSTTTIGIAVSTKKKADKSSASD